MEIQRERMRQTTTAPSWWHKATLLFGLALLPACAPRSVGAKDRPLEVIVSSYIDTIDPRVVVEVSGMRASRLAHAGLLCLDPKTLAPNPCAAESYRWLDERRLRVQLRSGVRFHSGKLLDVHDVVETFASYKRPDSRRSSMFEPLARVDAEGDSAIVFTLVRPYATLLTDLDAPILRADQARQAVGTGEWLDGLGPYRVAKFAPHLVEFEPAETGIGPRARHSVVVRTVTDENARALRLLSGRADISIDQVSPALLPGFERQRDLSVVSVASTNVVYLLVNHDRPALKRQGVRKAISFAIDRDRISKTFLENRARPAAGLLPFVPQEAQRFDARASRSLLRDEPHLTLSLLTSNDRGRVTIARFLAQLLADVGVTIEIVALEFGTLLSRLNGGQYDLALLQLPDVSEPNVLGHFLHSEFVPPRGANRGHVADAALDKMIDEGRGELDLELRRALYKRLDAHIRETLPVIPLWHEDHVAVVSARASGFVPAPDGRWSLLATLP